MQTTRTQRYLCYEAEEDTRMCGTCAHFHRHYTRLGHPMNCGHCAYPRMKLRNETDDCANWAKAHYDQ